MVFRYKSIAAYQRRLNRLNKEIRSKPGKATNKTAEWGAVRAAMLAPRDTGHLVNHIKWQGKNSTTAEIIQLNPGQANPSRSGKIYNYAMAMAAIAEGGSTPYNSWLADAVRRNGADPDYMEHAADETVVKFKQAVLRSVRDAITISK